MYQKTIERLQWKSQLIAFKCPWEERGAIGIFEHMCPHSIQVCTGVKLSVLYTIWDGNSVSRLFLEGGKKSKMSTETANQGIHCKIYSSEELNLMLNNVGVIKYTQYICKIL